MYFLEIVLYIVYWYCLLLLLLLLYSYYLTCCLSNGKNLANIVTLASFSLFESHIKKDTVAAQKYREYLDCSKVIKVVGMSTGVGFGHQPYQLYLVIAQPDLSNQVLIHWEKP